MIEVLVEIIDRMLFFILQRIIYPFILLLQKKWNYVIPPDTTKEKIVREHTVLNSVAIAADLICAILILVGLEQEIATYAGLMAIAMYILVDQGKIYSEQHKLLASAQNVCLIKGKERRIFKKYTPNLGRAIVAVLFIVTFIVLALFSMFQEESCIPSTTYNIAMTVMLFIMVWIKLKYYFTSMFMLKDCIIIRKREGE